MYVTNLRYLEERSSGFTELSDGRTEESNGMLMELDKTAVISEIDDEDLSNQIDSEAE